MRTFTVILAALLSLSAHAEKFSHELLADTLTEHVDNSLVDYKQLKADPGALNGYLDHIANISRTEFDSWSRDEQLALLINLYNAATLKLIIDHYPVDSIKDIGSWFRGPWDQKFVRLWGDTITLDSLEHEIIRKDYPEVPEIHFALVCAAMGCPPLRGEAYTGDRLDMQLADQRRAFLSNTDKNRVVREEERIYLSPIFKWYGEDFEKHAGSVLAYLKRTTWPDVDTSWSIRYTDYDWSLNEQ